MKLKAPEGVGDPCVAGVAIASRGGVYEVEAEIAAHLIECFGFLEVEAGAPAETAPKSATQSGSKSAATSAPKSSPAARRSKSAARKA